MNVQINVDYFLIIWIYAFGLWIVQSTDQIGMRGYGGAAPRKKLHFSYQGIKNFVDYSVLNMNIIPSITVEWNEDNIFMLLKIPLYEGGGYYTLFSNL